ncbi:uncharacterized protein Z518_01375 [Rhinocladiella mackenziei CBS 650.93]|uniref:Rhinocladiella mackenziei CBS 650.93 unplaced genomic scaffold supercont1.1, whole genome shotgun sequence n=1 Tax=Rhinocladiella mackenziei CBS 650.93 TaxID=1442369 RepID=A0A0D2HHX0_9EURO|nr:uncharacterized protein Z518_01375 [Rhinocladiella mackenziei CBS 650.93]KIX10293.1 hypothetical protein Z518_01375 [Rhinocladiella mackenziei CBS 650.93]
MAPHTDEDLDDGNIKRVQKSSGAIAGDAEQTPPATSVSGLRDTASISTRLSNLNDFFCLATSFLPSLVKNPLLTIEAYHPGLVSMYPFNISSSFVPAKDIRSLSGKVILVTGGNNGIGKESVLQLAKHNPHKIFLAARTESKARDAIASIKAQSSQEVDIEYLPLDLASLPSVRRAADQVIRRSDRLDILILNAGIMAVPPGKTASGQDIQMGTNLVGHFLLTKLLLPTLQKTAEESDSDVRVVSVSSEAWNLAPNLDTILSTEKLTATGPWIRYGASKAANIMFAAELARRYPTLTSVAIHPGIVKTDLYIPNTQANPLLKYGSMVFGPLIFQTIESGALNQLWASTGAKREDLVNGGYYTPVGKFRKNKWATDADAGKKLWEWTEKELNTAGY